MTRVCEVWTDRELAELVIGTTALASLAFLGIILLCVWLARSGPLPAFRCPDIDEAPNADERRSGPPAAA